MIIQSSKEGTADVIEPLLGTMYFPGSKAMAELPNRVKAATGKIVDALLKNRYFGESDLASLGSILTHLNACYEEREAVAVAFF